MPKTELTSPEVRREEYFIRAVGNAIDLIEFLSRSAQPVSLMQLTEAIGQSKSSVFRILCTLEKKGLVERRPGDLFVLSRAGSSLQTVWLIEKVKRVAQPGMRELSREFRETVSLAFLRENHIEIVEVIDSPQRIRMYNVLGGIIPPYASSVGKCITAHQPEALREHLLTTYGLHPFTPRTITDASLLEDEFRRVREQGYAADREESTAGGYCFGAPIWVSPTHVAAALSISLPEARLTDERRIVDAVRRTARSISDQLKI
jgi:DNA-binding IclR family transcriptional regulator